MSQQLLMATVLAPGQKIEEAEAEPVTFLRDGSSLVLVDDSGRRFIFDIDALEVAFADLSAAEEEAA